MNGGNGDDDYDGGTDGGDYMMVVPMITVPMMMVMMMVIVMVMMMVMMVMVVIMMVMMVVILVWWILTDSNFKRPIPFSTLPIISFVSAENSSGLPTLTQEYEIQEQVSLLKLFKPSLSAFGSCIVFIQGLSSIVARYTKSTAMSWTE